ncbi:MAG: amidohydrolase family protein [Terriglobia bacterium]
MKKSDESGSRKGGFSRRQFLERASAGLAMASVAGYGAWASTATDSQASSYSDDTLLNELRSLNIWDAHCHLGHFRGDTPQERMADMIHFADLLGVRRMCVSHGMRSNDHTPAGMRRENDDVMQAVAASHGRALGFCFLRPQFPQACLDELNRCVRDGPMVGVGELEIDVLCNSPLLDPIVDRASSMKAPILQHCWTETTGNPPHESTPYDLVELAKRHPHAQFICGHTGGNWELGIRTIRDTENIWAGIAGSDPTSGFVEMAVRELGAERVVYGSDIGGRTFASQIAKVIGADVSDSTKELIAGENLRRIMRPILQAKGYPV